MTTSAFQLDTPIGRLHGETDRDALTALRIGPRRGAATGRRGTSTDIEDRLARYFDGDLDALDGIPVAPRNGTPFQRRVWKTLRSIPLGETISYRDLAERVASPRAYRAVGSANGANPICIVLPCHRVIAADGSLGGYGGGLPTKRWLLKHEGVVLEGA